MNVQDLTNTIEWIIGIARQLDVPSDQFSPLVCSKPKKLVIGEWLSESLTTLKKVCIEYQNFQIVADPLELIKSQKQVIELQSELLACKNEQLQSVQSSVKTTVEESMKAEFDTYSSKLQSPAPVIAADTVKSFVRTVVEEEDRSRSLMVFGLAENNKENLSDKISAVFQDIGEKPRFEACRLGATSSGDDKKKIRPVKVTVSSSMIASQILSKSRKLSKTVDHSSVFICPDRSPDQRAKHRELVLEMRAREDAEPTKKHFIKRGAVYSSDGPDT
jgi:hypothetical protein